MPDTESICCCLCGWWRPVPFGTDASGTPREVRFDKVDPTTAPMWRRQRLSGAGRGSHDAKVETLETKGLKDLPEDIKEQIKAQCHKILEVLEG
ncbi:MAG: hypothetical protein ACUVTR_02090 [Dehalococcoidia bacterium]